MVLCIGNIGVIIMKKIFFVLILLTILILSGCKTKAKIEFTDIINCPQCKSYSECESVCNNHCLNEKNYQRVTGWSGDSLGQWGATRCHCSCYKEE